MSVPSPRFFRPGVDFWAWAPPPRRVADAARLRQPAAAGRDALAERRRRSGRAQGRHAVARRRGAAGADDARREDRPDDPGRHEGAPGRQGGPRLPARLGAVGRRLAAQAERAGDLGRNVRPLPEPGAVDAARDPDPLRRRRRPRPRRRQGRDDLPAQHRHGLHARSRARRGGGARDRARDRGHRASTGPSRPASRSRATSAGAAPTRASARTPELVASLGAAAIRGFEQRDRRHRRSSRPRKHFLADGGTQGGKDQGDARISEEELRRHPPARLRRRHQGRRRQRDGVVLQLERSVHARQQAPDHRRAQGRARLRRLRRHRLAGDRSDGARRLQPGDRHRDQRRHRHGDGAERVPRLHRAPQGAGRRRPRAAGAHRRRRPPHPEAEGALQAVGEAVHRSRADRARSARPRTARSRATPSARAWSC